ncbi:serine/threonine-protein kinase VRK1-like [Rhipicephalus sanguineus]|uniref:serine/threonine-protein kinase VRK1-like n=1 Tax=Rhipicephalus sanguineus TaxID=34632 RepID=UPI001894B7AD|nr:serine/threonine-protein kinase VRK1-like [Rhipicephalus sanguineus]
MRNSSKNRFMARGRFREYTENILDRRGKAPFMEITFSLAMRGINPTVYVERCKYIHAGVKASRRLLDFRDDTENVYRVGFDSSCGHTQNGKHKQCKEDFKKAHDGITQFRSGDAHIGARARRSDMELFGYILLQCLCYRLSWKDSVKYVSQQKSTQLENITLLMSKCFQHRDIPCGITKILQCAASTKFENTPDCKRLEDHGEGHAGGGFRALQLVTLDANEDAVAKLVLAKEARAERNHHHHGQHGRERRR